MSATLHWTEPLIAQVGLTPGYPSWRRMNASIHPRGEPAAVADDAAVKTIRRQILGSLATQARP